MVQVEPDPLLIVVPAVIPTPVRVIPAATVPAVRLTMVRVVPLIVAVNVAVARKLMV